MNTDSKKPTLGYYLLLAAGCGGLVGWFYLLRHFKFMEWLTELGPATHQGSMNLLAIMLWMLPAMLLWRYYLRWLNQHFSIGGQLDIDRHNAQYQDNSPPSATQYNKDKSSR